MEAVNKELQEKMAAYLEDHSAMMLSGVSEPCETTEWAAANSLPFEICAVAGPEHFEAIWEGICAWDKCLFLLMHLGTALEIGGKLDIGKHGHGYYNLSQANGGSIGGHIKIDDIKGIAFVSFPAKKFESMHIAFFNNDEKIKFSIFVGRGAERQLLPEAKASFFAMKEKLCVKK